MSWMRRTARSTWCRRSGATRPTPRSRSRWRRLGREGILDFGFWILDWSDRVKVVPLLTLPLIQNPKSKIQNPSPFSLLQLLLHTGGGHGVAAAGAVDEVDVVAVPVEDEAGHQSGGRGVKAIWGLGMSSQRHSRPVKRPAGTRSPGSRR